MRACGERACRRPRPDIPEVPCAHPDRLICLAAIMKEFTPHYIVHMVQVLLTEASNTPDNDTTIVGPTSGFRTLLADLLKEFDARGLTSSWDLLERLRFTIDSGGGIPALDLVTLTMDLIRRIQDDMKRALYLRLEGEESDYYSGKKPDWGKALSAFDIRDEVSEGTRSFGVGRYPAAAFHMMRVLEVGLNALAAELSVPYEHRNWENIINDIEARVREIDKSPDPHRKAKLHFYSAVAIHFRFLKDAWRNYVMHVKEPYSPATAHTTIRHVSEFMAQLAERRPWLS